MTRRPLPPLPLPLLRQEGEEDMKLPMKKTRNPIHLNKGPLPKKRKGRKFAHLLLGSGRRSPVVPLLPPPLTHLHGTGKGRFLALALPRYIHLPHLQLEVETRRGTSEGGQDPIPRVTRRHNKDLGPIPDPEEGGGGGEGVEIVAEGEIMAIVAARVVLRDIDKGAAVEIDRREENIGEIGEGLVDIGEQESVALLLNLTENVIAAEREESVMGVGGEGSVVLLQKNVIEIERGEDLVGIGEGGSVALLPSPTENVIETERGEEDLVETGEGGSIALLQTPTENVIETEKGEEDLVETGEGGSVALLLILTEDVVINMVTEGGEGAPLYVYVDHRIVTGTGAGGGGGGGVDLAAEDDV